MKHSERILISLGDEYENWITYSKVPAFAPTPSFHYPKLGSPVLIHPYLSSLDELLGYVVRYQTPEGKKITPTITYAQHMVSGVCLWIWKGFVKPRPIYGLNLLALEPEKPVIIFEGEKAVDAARTQKWFYEYVCIGYPGGHAGWKYTDWEPLRGKIIYLWPDNDQQGKKSFSELANHLNDICKSVHLLPLPDGLPESWDVADTFPEWLNP